MKATPRPRKTRREKLIKEENEKRKRRRLARPTGLCPWDQYRATMKKLTELEKKQNFLTRPSPTTFGSHRPRPLWQSVLCDLAYIFTLSIYKP